MTDIAYALGDFFVWTFGILELLGNIPNYLFIVLGIGGLVAWLMTQQRFLKEDRKAGNII